MKLISHRGNLQGPNPQDENHPNYILKALQKGYDVEIDVWYTDKLRLGHDKPQHLVDEYLFLITWGQKLWFHCKNIEAVSFFKNHPYVYLNYFWHEEDTITLTSQNYVISHFTKDIPNTICVMPEIHNISIKDKIGVISDYIQNYTK